MKGAKSQTSKLRIKEARATFDLVETHIKRKLGVMLAEGTNPFLPPHPGLFPNTPRPKIIQTKYKSERYTA
jgi:hypothetical protein